ncbi:MAG: Fic family protein [Actinomycetota bacterium]|nr:Fic family protein [Actinomycetota bacterium]
MRAYEQSHPWIDFEATDVNDVQPRHWMLLGEARSKCEHLAGAPLQPRLSEILYRITLVKGALATTAIEGNTLTTEEAEGILDGSFTAPPSRQYQETEVRNVLDALQSLAGQIIDGSPVEISFTLICQFNSQMLKGTDFRPGVVPGEIRTGSVAVGTYRAAPAEDCEYLLRRLVDWLNGPIFKSDDPEIQFALILAKAVYAHLYLAWIHPFGDGNGRTARLMEFAILANCGVVPIPAAHLLSNHYNLTRDRYYRELSLASKPGQSTLGFLRYAIEGFIDGLREVIGMVRDQQLQVAWVNYVHERFAEMPNTTASDRQRSLVLAMPREQTIPRADLEGLTRKIARLYAAAGPRTLSRDLNRLMDLGLIRRVRGGYRSRHEVVQAFLPPIAPTEP